MSHRPRRRTRPRIAVIAVSALAASFAATATADAAFPGKNGRIAFATVANDEYGNPRSGAIEWVNPDGSDRQVVPTCPSGQRCIDLEPAFAPGGKYLAFSSAASTGSTLGFIRSNFTALDRYRRMTASDAEPAWGPSGQRFLFTGATRAGAKNIYTLGCLSCGRKRITFSGGSQGAWSKRNEIAFVKNGNIVIRRAGGGGTRSLTGSRGGTQPNWSPHGTKLAFTRRGNVFVVNRDGKGQRKLTGKGGTQPVWSPNGRQIAFVRKGNLFVVNANGGGLRQIATAASGTTLSHPDWQPLK